MKSVAIGISSIRVAKIIDYHPIKVSNDSFNFDHENGSENTLSFKTVFRAKNCKEKTRWRLIFYPKTKIVKIKIKHSSFARPIIAAFNINTEEMNVESFIRFVKEIAVPSKK